MRQGFQNDGIELSGGNHPPMRKNLAKNPECMSGLSVPVSTNYCNEFHSTVTLFAKFRGLSTSCPRSTAAWQASSCSGTTVSKGLSGSEIGGT